MEGGEAGVHEAMRQARAEVSYWLSGASGGAAAAPSYSGDPEEEEEEAGPAGPRAEAGWGEGPRKNGAPSPPGMAAG